MIGVIQPDTNNLGAIHQRRGEPFNLAQLPAALLVITEPLKQFPNPITSEERRIIIFFKCTYIPMNTLVIEQTRQFISGITKSKKFHAGKVNNLKTREFENFEIKCLSVVKQSIQ